MVDFGAGGFFRGQIRLRVGVGIGLEGVGMRGKGWALG